ncbi:MAG TPA: N-methyl-D-aspartate receptor NMDAR2C subunit [Thermoanaerobaculia bacterium]|nr:N-methyl-D-aspartate receptor NMDAR2C subunit [Thermoanaerobaculia bacterium]
MNPARFAALWRALELPEPPGLFDRLRASYAEPHRAYHTAQHIDECLAQLELVREQCERPAEVELALWFHDAIYDTRAHDNEPRSADWAARELASAGASSGVIDTVRSLILITRHNAIPATRDEQLLSDIDLSILGAPRARFDEYEAQVRREYAWVPDDVFQRERGKILQSFLARPSIYATEFFRARLEETARENLTR